MKQRPITAINSLSKQLDIFDRKEQPDQDLINSGLYPPLPVSGAYLVHGFPLLETAIKMGITGLFALELPEMEKPALLALSLKCENRAGNYSWPEMERMMDFLDHETVMDKTLVSLIQGHEDPLFHERIRTYRNFSPSLKQLVGNKILDLKTAHDVRELPDAVFSSLLCNKQKLSFSRIRIFLTTLDEIARRDLLEESGIIRTCNSLLSQKKPVEVIKKMRFPELSGLYERLINIKNATVKGSGIHLEAPPFFEGDSFEIRFRFQSKHQLEKRIKVLEGLKERSDELFGLL